MASIKVPRLTDAEAISRYQAGESLTMVALRAKMPNAWVKEVLAYYNVELRDPVESRRLMNEIRLRTVMKNARSLRARQGLC